MSDKISKSIRKLTYGLTVVAALSSLGCGGAKTPDLFAVSGQVTFQGQPVPGAKLVFIPQNEDPKSLPRDRSRGETDADGNFEMTWGADQIAGSPAGNYKVIVFAYQDLGEAHDDEITPPSLIPEKYNSPITSGLTATVTEDDENVVNFDLSP
ncbi:MAG TPA: hypothetical protein VGH74_04680 [Planctomycetaceae bacterium]